MNELTKTAIYVVAAVVMIGVALVSIPPREIVETEIVETGKVLFPEFDDPLKAKKFTIIRPDGDLAISAETKVTSQENEFVLEQQDGRWVLASHGNYPVDGNEQLQVAATALVGLKVLSIASEVPEDHELFGVVRPIAGESSAGKKGVGMEVRFDNSEGKPLADIIIGKAPKDGNGQRFVRKVDSDVVCVAEISPELFTNEFSAWVDPNLLKINPFDIESITIHEYDLSSRGDGNIVFTPKMDLKIGLTASPGRNQRGETVQEIGFQVEELISYTQGERQQQDLLATETLNQEALSDLVQTLNSLPLEGVDRKPSSVGRALRLKSADEALTSKQLDAETRKSLKAHEFQVGQFNGQLRIYGLDDLMLETKEGVQVWLYFGGPAGVEETADSVRVKRYLLLLARLNEAKFPKPELTPVPTEPNENEDEEEFQIRKADVEKYNGRLTDEWEESIAKAKGEVERLNARFADWYYIIDQTTYDKLHIDERDAIVEKQGAQSIGYNVDAFRELEAMGLKNPRPQSRPRSGFPQF